MANYLLMDLNSIGRAAHSSTKLSVGGEQVQAIFGTIKTVQRLLKKYPNHKLIALNDGKAQWRFNMFPLYKGNRSNDAKKIAENEAYHAQKSKIIEALKCLGVIVITDPNAEADDLAGYFSRKLGKDGNKVRLITGDADWKQLVSENVMWEDHRDDRFCDHKNFQITTGFNSPSQFVEAKCLTGDTSDNIPGVGGIGADKATKLLASYGSVYNFMAAYDAKMITAGSLNVVMQNFADNVAPKDSTKYGKMEGARDAFKRNMELMELDNYRPNKSTLQIRGGPTAFCKMSFKGLCEDFSFRSILMQFDTWIAPFEKLRNLK